MFEPLYRWMLSLAASPRAAIWLFAVAFAEASVFPIPVDLLLIPLVLARRDHAWRLAAVCTAGSVAGALGGWLLGAFLLERVAMPIIQFYHGEHTLAALQARFVRYGVLIVLLKGLTPIPFKIVTLAAGAAHFPLAQFLPACILTRGARFFLVAGLLRYYGAPVQAFVERRLTLVMTGLLLLIALGFVALRYA